MDYTTLGIDVSKNTLDVCFLPSRLFMRVPNDQKGYAQILNKIKKSNPKILLESTGVYHKAAQEYFTGLGLKVYVLNPKLVRDYAKSCGKLAKTDKIDALMIATYGETHDLRESAPVLESSVELRALAGRRRQMVGQLALEKQHLDKAVPSESKHVVETIEAAVMFYKNQIEAIEGRIKELIKSDAVLMGRYNALAAVAGVGLVTATELMSCMPELGRMNKREAAALAGVAPMNCDSGVLRGQRHIRGGQRFVYVAFG